MAQELIDLTYLYEIGTIIGIAFFVFSLYLIMRIKQLFPGGKIIQKWRIMQILVVLFIITYVFDWIVWIYDFQDLLFILGGIIRLSTGLFIILIIMLFYKTYKLILLKSKSDTKHNN